MRLRFPQPLTGTAVWRYIMHFEAAIEDAVRGFAGNLTDGSRVLDAGAGEGQYAHYFDRQHYVGVDLGVGDAAWDYRRLQAVADLTALPFQDESFDACFSIVTLEHVKEPASALGEIARSLKPGARVLLVVPHEWEVHQSPHDYWRFTRHGIRYLLEEAGFREIRIEPVGGFFRLLARRLMNGMQVVPLPLLPVAALLFAPPALILPIFDSLDRQRDFTLGYICTARKSS
jgi:SAM-dependent methyltransferase